MISIDTTFAEIATELDCPVNVAKEVIRKLFLTSSSIPLPDAFRVNLAQPVEYSGQVNFSSIRLTVQMRGWGGNKVVDKATLLVYIKESAKALVDLQVWHAYNGPKAPAATGTNPEPVWVPHYPPQGIYAVYPPSIAPDTP
jgi:hypothetical protein